MPGGRARKVGRYQVPESESVTNGDNTIPLPIVSEVPSSSMMTDSSARKSSLGEADIDTPAINASNYQKIVRQLDLYYGVAKRKILRYQSPTTGLFPRCSDDKKQAYLRDSIYCAAGVWALYQAYRRIDDDRGKAYELGQSAVKCMRGVLFSWLRQSKNVEEFKQHQNLASALHSKFHLVTGEPIIDTNQYSHAQIDIPALYLIYLVQMISSGLQVIYTMDEVNFIQNLVYYVERAYRTADFGIWERGSKANDGTPEVHASCLGMVKAALEAVNGCNLFGEQGTAWSVIYVDIDAHNRNRSILETLLPRESSSKNVDVALLATISYPAFATHDPKLYRVTKEKIFTKLEGEYGFKRFFRDGFGTSIEDRDRRFYYPGETKNFDNIECEWPIFYTYLIIDGVFKNLPEQVAKYQKRLHDKLIKDSAEDALVPMYYYVPEDCVELERQHPGSNPRVPSLAGSQPGHLFLWGQSMYLISQLLVEELLHINELDPIRRYLPSFCRPRRTNRYSAFQGPSTGTANDLVVQIVLIAESMRLQAMMATYGIQTQTPHEVDPVQIWPQSQLVKAYKHLGVNKKLGLLGRPLRPVGALGTSKIYRILGHTILCYPLTFEVSDFYLSHDMSLLIDDIKNELTFVGRYWRLSGRPTVCLLVREEHMRDVKFKEMLDLLAMLRSGRCDKLQVRVGRVQNMISSSCMEHLDFLHTVEDELEFQPFTQLQHASAGYQSLTDIPKYIAYSEELKDYEEFQNKKTWEVIEAFKCQSTLHGRSQLLAILLRRHGHAFLINNQSVKELMEDVNRQAGALRHWQVVRFCSSSLHKMVDSISPFVTSILVNGKQVTFGILGEEEVVIDRPMNPGELRTLVYNTLQEHDPYQAVLQQEIMLYIGKLISTNPRLFNGILNIRIGWIIHAVELYVIYFLPYTEPLERLSPSELRRLVYQVLNVGEWTRHSRCTPFHRRRIEGAIGRVPSGFHARVWKILSKTPGGIVVAGNHLPQQPTISDMTMQELNFSLTVDKMLNRIEQPEERQVVVELMIVLATILERNPEVTIDGTVDTNTMVNEAIGLYQKDQNLTNMNEASSAFYGVPPTVTSRYLARAVVNFVLKSGATMPTDVFCAVS